MVIVPTELISDNGKKLESIVIELAHLNGLEEAFIDWLENANRFCNSLVDRIVPGKPDEVLQRSIETRLGYTDELLIMSEVYRLWAIEGDEEIAETLSFARADKGVVVAKDINLFRELKLRLLNGTHTLCSGVAFLSGIDTVKNAMDDEQVRQFISDLMQKEIAAAIPYPATGEQRMEFARSCLDRFCNPYIHHQWLSITVQYSSKMKMRVVPVLLNYYALFSVVPEFMATGFAAYICFMKAVKKEGDKYFGRLQNDLYLIQDDQAAYLYSKWQNKPAAQMAVAVLTDTGLWGQNLAALPGFAEAVQEKINDIEELGMAAVIDPLQSKKSIA